ncbi:MAG: hypothetical protein KGL92_08785 [Gammaproteobacteria bacterium]|nr:hypothetical protein [Gammaproteobacteria bacterium]
MVPARALLRGAGSFLAAVMVAVAPCAPGARAAEKPLWEVGFGVGAIAFNDYRGADTSHVYPLPVPYIIISRKVPQV